MRGRARAEHLSRAAQPETEAEKAGGRARTQAPKHAGKRASEREREREREGRDGGRPAGMRPVFLDAVRRRKTRAPAAVVVPLALGLGAFLLLTSVPEAASVAGAAGNAGAGAGAGAGGNGGAGGRFCDGAAVCVFDVGHNTGQDTVTYLSDGRARVVAVDANPALIARSRERFAREVAAGRLVLVATGLAGADGETGEREFWVNRNDKFSSFTETLGCRDGYGRAVAAGNHSFCERVRLRTQTCRMLVERFGTPTYMKIDIEGLDRACVESVGGLARAARPRYVSVENVREAYVELLAGMGYAGFKAVNQWRLQQGVADDMRGHSGPWGEQAVDDDTGTRWSKAEDFRRRLPLPTSRRVGGRDVEVWYDLHAKMG